MDPSVDKRKDTCLMNCDTCFISSLRLAAVLRSDEALTNNSYILSCLKIIFSGENKSTSVQLGSSMNSIFQGPFKALRSEILNLGIKY